MDKHYCPYCMTPVAEGESCRVCGLTAGTYVPSPHHLPPGTVLAGRYLVGRVLGEGGFGITYIGCDLRLELKVAIKEYYPCDRATRNASASLEVTSFIGPSAKSFDRGKKKFLSEAQVMAKLDKQQVIVSVRDFFEINNTAYIVMEYVEGITLHELVERKGGKIDPGELFPMLEPLFGALSIMHENGLIHRDISPDNLMLENGKIRLLDFGCAREASRGTETMTIALKHGYAPIEQYQQKGQGPWTDIYALSATIYYCLTGKVPPQALDRISGDELLLPGKLGVNLTKGQEQALLKGMRLQPNRRFSTVKELWAGLYARPAESDGQSNAGDDVGFAGGNVFVESEPPGVSHEGTVQESAEAVYAGKAEGMEAAHGGMREEQGIVHEVTQEPPQMEIQTSPEAGGQDSGGTDTAMDGSHGQSKKPEKPGRRRVYLLSGIAAACAALFIGFMVYRNGVEEPVNPTEESIHLSDSSGAGSDASESEEDSESAGGADGEEAQKPDLFVNAATFTGWDEKEFRRLLEDDSVTAIILDCGNFTVPENITIAKPVLVAEGTVCNVSQLTVAQEGYICVEGALLMSEAGCVRLEGSGVRLWVAGGGTLNEGTYLVWMDWEGALAREDGRNINLSHKLVFKEDIFEGDGVASVRNYEELSKAARLGQVISIDGDITIEEDIGLNSPVRISEGVTVRLTSYSDGAYNDSAYHGFGIGNGGLLVNNGILDGRNLWLDGNGVVINNGSLVGDTSKAPGFGNCASMWIQEQGTFVNYGTVEAGVCSRFWDSSLCLNMETGIFHAYDFYLVGGDMGNYGQVTVPEGKPDESWPGFFLLNESRLVNFCGSLITVEAYASFENGSYLSNFGDMVVKRDGSFRNTVLENYGFFQAEYGSRLDEYENAGIYCGNGEYDLGNADVKVYASYNYGIPYGSDRLVQVDSEEALRQALNSADAEDVCVTADITVNANLTFRKNLYIAQGCRVDMAEGTALNGYGSVLMLDREASLHGGDISFYDDAQLYMCGGSALEVEPGGVLTLDSSMLWGWQGIIHMDGAGFLLKNRGGFWFNGISSMEADGGEITLQSGSVFVVSSEGVYGGRMRLAGASITLSGDSGSAYFHVAGDVVFRHCNLDINGGVLYNRAKTTLTLEDCRITVGENGRLDSECAGLSMLDGTSMEIWGIADMNNWDEHVFTVQGQVTNHGTLNLNMPTEITVPIDNRGTLTYSGRENDRYRYYHGKEKVDLSKIIGNAPVNLN